MVVITPICAVVLRFERTARQDRTAGNRAWSERGAPKATDVGTNAGAIEARSERDDMDVHRFDVSALFVVES